jgi:thiol-disulfide isomerase/thioredoxin
MLRPRFLAPRLALVATLAFVLGACAQKAPAGRTGRAVAALDPATLEFVEMGPDSLGTVIAAAGAQGTLVNVWASWCEPCREEFPEIVRLARDYRSRGLRVVFVSADFPEDLPNARKFLAEQGVSWPTYYKRSGNPGDDERFIAAFDPRWSGALPGSFVYDAHGKLRDFWEGKATYAQIEKRVRPVLSLPEAPDTTVATTS